MYIQNNLRAIDRNQGSNIGFTLESNPGYKARRAHAPPDFACVHKWHSAVSAVLMPPPPPLLCTSYTNGNSLHCALNTFSKHTGRKTLASADKGSGECSLSEVQQKHLGQENQKMLDRALPISNSEQTVSQALKASLPSGQDKRGEEGSY